MGKNFEPGNKVAENTLLKLLETASDEITRMEIAYTLGQVNIGHPVAVNTLTQILGTASQAGLRRKVAYQLGKIDPGNTAAADTLVDLIQSPSTPKKIGQRVIKDLRQIFPEHPLLKRQFTAGESRSKSPKNSSAKPTKDPEKTLGMLEMRLAAASEMKLKRKYAISLLKLQPGHRQAISALMESLRVPEQTQRTYRRTVEILKNGLTPEQFPLIVTRFKPYGIAINRGDRSPQTLEIYKLLWYAAQQMSYADFCAAWHQLETGFNSSPDQL